MATEIGQIKALIGTVVATAADGAQRTLQVGDKLFANEIISTGAAGAVEIEFADGSVMDLGRNSQAVLDNEMFDPQQAMQAQADVQDDVEALQQSLLEGTDPTQVGEATAAGAGPQSTGNEGTTSVTVEYLAPEVPVTSGFDTTGPSVAFPPLIDDTGIVDGAPTAVDDGVIAGIDLLDQSNAIFEDFQEFNSDLGTVNSRADYLSNPQTINGNLLSNDSFGTDGPGGLVSVSYHGVTADLTQGAAAISLGAGDPGGPAWTLTVQPDGSYEFTMFKPYHHSGQGEDIAQELFSYTIADANGDTASANLTINIVDDVPHIAVTPVSDVQYEFTMTNHDEVSSAGYHSSYGYYVKDAAGDPATGVVVWNDVKDHDTIPVTVTGYTPDQIGFFIIPNGGNNNASLLDGAEVTFSQDGHNNWQATLSNGTPLTGNGAHVYFDDFRFNNADHRGHVEDNQLIGNQNWEDLPLLTGDGDFNDVNTNVAWTQVEATGDAVDISFGADDGFVDIVDFSVTDLSGLQSEPLLTSNGNSITFGLRDTNADGHADQLFGSADGHDVLTVSGVLDSGAYNLELFGPIDAIEPGQPGVNIGISATVNVTDGDGDFVSQDVNFNLNITDLLPPITTDSGL